MGDFIFAIATFYGLILIYLLLGALMRKKGRGYNSLGRAMASMEAQNFAARYAGGKIMLFSAIALVPMTIMTVLLFVLPTGGAFADAVFWVQFALAVLPPAAALTMTEVKLRRRFDKNGRPYR